ncbi:hypothetical protein GCM10009530_72410 [Microbispora corallina]|uniref:WXG100 family type VII secretion target n=1 Tax=Microbispora corallina TaxID=83302 RepID=A0ABQ4G4C2_9ACTN|nr:hypothetical protein [Microbispora corallina]GIH41911.1 hypothetical protein Mco01_49110 [Microbispora corallina]
MAEVTNPLHTHLTQLLTRVQRIQDELKAKMDNPTQNMAGGKVWTSTAATEWSGHLTGQCGAYNSAVNSLDDELVAMLARTPQKCSPEEAKLWHMELGR